jgi:hypothetical protein
MASEHAMKTLCHEFQIWDSPVTPGTPRAPGYANCTLQCTNMLPRLCEFTEEAERSGPDLLEEPSWTRANGYRARATELRSRSSGCQASGRARRLVSHNPLFFRLFPEKGDDAIHNFVEGRARAERYELLQFLQRRHAALHVFES